MIGQVLGHYRLLEKIGGGGMGEVFRARDDRLERDVAVKIIRPASSADQDRIRRFEQEARAAAALSHPNILAIYDIGIYDGTPYIVSELLEGQTLRQCLFEGPLPVRQAADYALQIAQGLIAAHEKHIVHRDLKPENLFIAKGGRVKILDFGIAKLIPEEESVTDSVEGLTTQTRAGVVLGTVSYMSPEQLRGRPVDHRSDIFTLGAILYEMLSGRRAFHGDTNVDTITAVLKEEPARLIEIRPNIPASFEPIVSHCLEKDSDCRFQSARDLAFALGTLTNISTSKQQLVPIAAIKSQSRKRWMWVTAVLVLAVACGALLGAFFHSAQISPSYTRLTFERGTIYSARFSSDGRNVIYGASWNGRPLQLYSTPSDSPLEHPLEVGSAHLLDISSSNEMALELRGRHGSRLEFINGTLARAPLAGGAPREVLDEVRWADWDSKNELAVVHHVGGRSRLEYPIGKVLYETAGWISDLRVSPKDQEIAFLEHPALWDDRGSVCVVDMAGHKTELSSGWESEDGLAWSKEGDEIWFTATERGYNRALWAVTLSGKKRQILSAPGGLTLQDVARDGRALITFDNERLAMETSHNGDRKDAKDLSWYDWTIPTAVSRNGQWVLFEEASEPTGPNYTTAIRKLDGSAPIRLGDGSPGDLSPDGKWAVSIFTGTPEHITLLPIGTGEPQNISPAGVDHLQNGSARFMPDGKRILFGGESAGRLRSYILDINGGNLRPVTPEGVVAKVVSPDGKYVAGWDPDLGIKLYSITGGEARSIPGLDPGFAPAQWSADGSALYVYRNGEMPLQVYRVNLGTGKQQMVREITPADSTGVVSVGPIAMSLDASRYVYSYYHNLSVLYIISGLK